MSTLSEFVCVFVKACDVKVGVESRHSEDVPLATSQTVVPQHSAASASAGSDAGILESIEHQGGSVADDVNFLVVVQRIFTRTLSGTK